MQKRLRSVRPALLKFCNSLLAHSEERNTIPGLHVDFSEKKQKTEVHDLLTGDGLRKMTERRNCYAAGAVFRAVSADVERKVVGGERRSKVPRPRG